MTEWVLETIALALSIFITVSFLWPGLTVLLNGDRRQPVVWFAVAGLLVGSLFFLSHTMILGRGLTAFGFGMDFWWRLAWTSVTLAPPLWCLVVLRYADVPEAHWRWYRLAQVALVLVGIVLVVAFAVLNPFPSYDALLHARSLGATGPSGIPLPVWLYIPYAVACYLMPLIALRPRPVGAVASGTVGRRRARPWLAAVSLLLLLVGLVVAVLGMWAAQNTQTQFIQ